MAVFAPHVRMVGQHRDTRPQGLVRVIYPQVHLCQIRQEHIHAARMRIMPTDKNPACAGFFYVVLLFIAVPWHDSMRMRRPSSQSTVSKDCVGRAMVANCCIFCCCRCLCIWHSDAMNMFDLKSCLCRWCILQRRFDSWHRFDPILWMTRPDMHLQKTQLL